MKEEAQKQILVLEAEISKLKQIIDAPNNRDFDFFKQSAEKRLFDRFNGCTIKIDKGVFPNSIFYIKDDIILFEQGLKHFFCSYDRVWSIFEKEYSMKYDQIQELVKNVIEGDFKIMGLLPIYHNWTEEDFKIMGLRRKNRTTWM